ncbi:MAG: rane protein [Alphaproteobacteria bacterium]|nr:rane protein [Alphaproteobacteria bacterium]
MLAKFTVALLVLAILGLPVAAVLMILGLLIEGFVTPVPIHAMLGSIAWENGRSDLLFSVSGVAARMYSALLPWLNWLPGRLMHTNIATCTLFAATSGSSVATAATVGTVAIPQIKALGYNERLFLGSLAAGGTLGILIPPSINMIIYGALTNTSIPQLYLGGVLPGFLLAGLFMLTILIACLIRPRWSGRGETYSWGQRLKSLPDLLPPIGLFLLVVGSIYAGWATATEAAALGVLAALGLCLWSGRFSLALLHKAFEDTMRTTAMIMLILVAAFFLNFAVVLTGLVRQLTDVIGALNVTPQETVLIVVLMYLMLGCVLDVLSMTVLTVPVLTPIMVALGYDAVWFGILVMLVSEAALITPPVGMNAYVIQSLRTKGRIEDVFIGTLPFLIAMLVTIAIITLWPDIVMVLPRTLMR